MLSSRNSSPVRVAAFYRRCAAIHEAGHLVAADWRGVEAYGRIWATGSDDPNDKPWIGAASMRSRTSAATERLIGVAGAVAEYCWRYQRDAEQLLEDWLWEDPDIMSPSDWQWARTAPGEPDRHFMRAVERVHAQFNPTDGKLWPEVCGYARQMIINSRPLSSQQLDLIRAA